MTIRNIDIEPEIYEILKDILEMDDEENLLLLHQRKSVFMDSEAKAHLLELVKVQINDVQNHSGKIKAVHFVDCCGDAKIVHSEFSLLGDIITLFTEQFEPDITANVLLLDYDMPQDIKVGLLDGKFEVRNLLDPSVYADTVAQTMQVMEDVTATMDPDSIDAFNESLRLGIADFVKKIEVDSVFENSEAPVQ